MKRFLFAAIALLAMALVFVGQASAAPAARRAPVVAAHAQVAQAAPTATATKPVVATTPAVVTETKKDRRGLLGLIGLLGLLGLLKRPRKEIQTVVERPINRVAEPIIERPRQ